MKTLSIIQTSSRGVTLSIAAKPAAATDADSAAWTTAANEILLVPRAFYGARVQRSTNRNFVGFIEFDTTERIFFDSRHFPPPASTTFYYRAKERNEGGALEDNWSNTVSFDAIVPIRLPPVTSDFHYNLIALPEYYFESEPDWSAVTRERSYEDGGKAYNELNDVAPQTWELIYPGLSKAEDEWFGKHFRLKRTSRPFTFYGKNGLVVEGVHYLSSESSHERNMAWINTRRIKIIKNP